MDVSVELAPRNQKGLRLQNPLMLASGTCGYVTELEGVTDIHSPGAFVCKGTTLKPGKGNPQPRIAEVTSGMLNAIGLENIGIDSLISNQAPTWNRLGVCVIVNIAGSNTEEYVEIARRLEGTEGISGIELNISCPNVKSGGVEFGLDPETAATITREVKCVTTLPLIVKLSPGAASVSDIATAVTKAGADALTLINTFKGMAIDINRRRPLLGNTTGGLSGPILKPVALAMVYETARLVDVPLIACGGISSAEDAIEFIMAGASAVQVGTAFLVDPCIPGNILTGIKAFLSEQEVSSINKLIGCAVTNSK